MSVLDTTLPLDPDRFRADFPILSTSIHENKPLIYLDNTKKVECRQENMFDEIFIKRGKNG